MSEEDIPKFDQSAQRSSPETLSRQVFMLQLNYATWWSIFGEVVSEVVLSTHCSDGAPRSL